MRFIKLMYGLIAILSLLVSSSVYADWGGHGFRGHHGGGFHHGGWGYGSSAFIGGVGIGYGYGAYNYYPYAYPSYSYPTEIVVVPPAQQPVYIQQSAPQPVAKQYPAGYWYHCSNPEGYYPYIKDCPNGWQQVEPTPAKHN